MDELAERHRAHLEALGGGGPTFESLDTLERLISDAMKRSAKSA